MSRTREALVGLVIVAALVLAAAGTLWLQGSSFGQERQTVEAVFYQVGQITEGSPVKLRGVEVGRVGEVRVEPDSEFVRLRLELGQAVAMPTDPVILLSPESMFGDWQAEIVSRSGFPYFDYPDPGEARTLPGHALPDFSQLTAAAQRISENLGTLTDRFGIAFSEETARNIASLIDNIEGVTTQLSELVEQQAASFTEVTDGVQAAADQIGEAAEQARVTFEDASEVLTGEAFLATLEDLAEVSSNLRELSNELGGTNADIQRLTQRIDTTFIGVQEVVQQIRSGEGTVGRLLGDESLAVELETTLTELGALLEDIRENPNRYVRLSIF